VDRRPARRGTRARLACADGAPRPGCRAVSARRRSSAGRRQSSAEEFDHATAYAPAAAHSGAAACGMSRKALRMDEHPLIRFAEGPAGRRARLLGTGKDVWEVVAAVRDNDGDLAEAARYLETPLGLVQAAVSYYGAYPDEIDQWIDLNEQEAAEAHAAYAAGRAAVRR
jgi:hypothetical protein